MNTELILAFVYGTLRVWHPHIFQHCFSKIWFLEVQQYITKPFLKRGFISSVSLPFAEFQRDGFYYYYYFISE